MNSAKTNSLALTLVSLLVFTSSLLFSAPPTLDANEMREIVDIAKRIHKLQPDLDEGKYLEYGTGIYRASVQYDIEADILIAITKQETSFRENLPEGAAGELGICQIRKIWLGQADFKAEFPKAKIKDFHRPAKSFLFAAWILRDLKNTAKKGVIPYWSYYNARKFEPRLRYYTAVSRHLTALTKYDGEVIVEKPKFPSARNERKYEDSWKGESVRYAQASWSPEPIQFKGKKAKPSRAPAQEGSWIASALKKLQTKKKSGLSNGAIMQAATELNLVDSLSPNRLD